ncbi:AraC family transcriptional regulator [Escherichia coli]|uniref:AraC family transcriptional regulator n=1 Tax=Escherichia coli TaxID=562 RepID=UPI000D10340D|nr:AraC family transcriptional regulator [Escherichia coli]NJV49035.1 AraC family transcriptional regulator [Escherichia coli]
MSGVCFFILVKESMELRLLKNYFIFNYGDTLLVKNSIRDRLVIYPEKYMEFELNDTMISKYLSRYENSHALSLSPPPEIIRRSFAYPDLLINIINNININNHTHQDFKSELSLSLLSIFCNDVYLSSFLTSVRPTFSEKVRSAFLSDISRNWKLKDLADYFYMSESLIKRKLLLEKTSFSKILFESRMFCAIKLLKQNYPIKYVAEMSGFKSTSYFVSLFRQHYNYTPRQYINKKP